MAFGAVIKAAIRGGTIIQTSPASEVLHPHRPCPKGIDLMPCNHTPICGRIAKVLVIAQPHGVATDNLTGRHDKGRNPEHIMKALLKPPMSQGMKQHVVWISGFVAMKLVKEVVKGM